MNFILIAVEKLAFPRFCLLCVNEQVVEKTCIN